MITGRVAGTVLTELAQTDPTGLSSTAGQLVMAAALVAVLVVLIGWWVRLRRRDRDR